MKTMAGVSFKELGDIETNFLIDELEHPYLLVNPMPNLYFTRDPFASVGNGAVINKMFSVTRNRETIYADYIFKYHPEYKGQVKDLYGRHNHFHIEGGDVFNVDEKNTVRWYFSAYDGRRHPEIGHEPLLRKGRQ